MAANNFEKMSVLERIVYRTQLEGIEEKKIKYYLAEVCGISRQSINQWFSGYTKRIRAQHLGKLADAFGVTVEWLLTGIDPEVLERMSTRAQVAVLLEKMSDDQQQDVLQDFLSKLTPERRKELSMFVVEQAIR
jgi:transcriptional regulator with XRE-family HTH domain